MKHVLLIDGMALLFRSFFATAVSNQFMYNHNGTPTNGVQGFIKHTLTAAEIIKPTHVAICWDMGKDTFRNEEFSLYKANRNAPPEELIPQFDLVKEVADHLSFHNIGVKGYEADDCIGTIAKMETDSKVSIVSGDKDLLQLLAPNVDVWLIKKGFGTYETYNLDRFLSEYEITPKQFIDVKGLMGDTSDGYPGVKGIGEKTAFKLIKEFGSIEGILENIDRLTPGQRNKITQDQEMLHLSRKLAEIHCEVPLDNPTIKDWNGLPDHAISVVDQFGLRSVKKYMEQKII
ncbi:5'-3' exonuclease [Jeotgalibacillus haloalkalitolerans]|uniref:5'-3' exonuclease n=1 Tax=Jeotgalibacillus haloalkalitolerans TaxID=3104292 RepID=A0ABU5KL49_9BACL|nr:5'-3' exonuclease [Jeotgalibacillus sp. HH7-29]MDZ5711963.1 5'-3' exonuclease [Jeotgalibacillus sp. HH7-29]